MGDELVLTPGGFRPRSKVHLIEAGHFVKLSDGHMLKVNSSGKVIADFGPIGPPGSGSNPNWITYSYWQNENTDVPISSFRTTWIVPPPPSTLSGQTIYLFNGLMTKGGDLILQPVLQWGPSRLGGGNYWVIACWHVSREDACYSAFVKVNPGDTLVGVMTQTSQGGPFFNCNCIFEGIPDTNLTIQNVQEFTYCVETLEAYNNVEVGDPPTNCTDYPHTARTRMTAIDIQPLVLRHTVFWTPVNNLTDCGQETLVIKDTPPSVK